ncbi:TPA: UbiD family decarboxylase [Pseudomonas putida]|nr:UbiD family decarboxylase [Pseudomonas putida]
MAQTDTPIDPNLELLSDYLGAYRTTTNSVMSAEQPLRLYRKPRTGAFAVLLGVFGSRSNSRIFLDPQGRHSREVCNAELVYRAIMKPIAPVLVCPAAERAVIKNPDLQALLPALTCSIGDPGPTITLGMVYARDERSGTTNCSVHRITIKPSSVAIAIYPGGDLQRLIDLHTQRGERLSVSVNIGMDPAIYIAAALSKPALGFRDDELGVAGAIRGRSVELAPCYSNAGRFVEHAEIVLEATLGTEMEAESEVGDAHSMPEYLGYYSPCGEVSTLRVSALSHRPGAFYQALSGPGREQSELLGAGQEASILRLLKEWGMSTRVKDIVAQPAGGGHLFTVLQVVKSCEADDQLFRQLAKRLLEAISSTKNIVLVDEDVNPCSAEDVLWAMSTRFRAELDIHCTKPLPGTPLDPTLSSLYCLGKHMGAAPKSIFDCTVPFALRSRFRRAFA